MVPPLIFGHSVQTSMAEGGPKLKNQWGSNKIENMNICLGNTHCMGNSKFIFFILYPTPWETIGATISVDAPKSQPKHDQARPS